MDEAVAAGAAELGVRPADCEVEVLDEGGRGWLGLSAREARVRVRRTSKGAAARRFVEELAALLQSAVDVETQAPESEEGSWLVTVATPDAARWIGHRGQALDALGLLCDVAATRASGSRERLMLDVGGYRERREASLRAMARTAAERARRLGRQVALEPMSAAERRIVHLAVQELGGVRTESVGAEPRRRVLIIPEE